MTQSNRIVSRAGVFFLVFPLLIATAGQSSGGEVESSPIPETKTARGTSPSRPTPVFVPRSGRGKPAARIGGASRGSEGAPAIRALVPRFDDDALTLAEQPVLYWHLSVDTPHGLNITLVDPLAIDPVINLDRPGPTAAGVQTLRMADERVRLRVGKRYLWFVAVVTDPARRSADIVARGAVERVAAPALVARVEKASSLEAARILGGAGIWYDTLALLSEAADRGESAPQHELDQLLAEAGLDSTGTN